MADKKTQILFTPDVKKINEMGANWYNIVLDITEYLNTQGFTYSRTLGFVNDRELSEEELSEIAQNVMDIALGAMLHFDTAVISNVVSLKDILGKSMN